MSHLSTREREALAVLSDREWLTTGAVRKIADLPSANNVLARLYQRGALIERRLIENGRYEWRRTGAEVRFNEGGPAWSSACGAFEPGDDLRPLPEDICGTCGRRFDAHGEVRS